MNIDNALLSCFANGEKHQDELTVRMHYLRGNAFL